MSDTIVYGAICTWWDDKDKVGHLAFGMPCCPFCKRVLFEIDANVWETAIDHAEVFNVFNDRDDYADLIAWSQGKCYPSADELLLSWLEHKQKGTLTDV